MLVGEAMCRGFDSDVNGGGGGGVGDVDGDGDGGTDAVLATLTDRTEPLPQELWLHILTFLCVSELGRRVSPRSKVADGRHPPFVWPACLRQLV